MDDFVKQFDGKGIDWDGAYGFQCMDLAHKYAHDVVGTDIPNAPAAKDVWDKSTPGFDKIKNTPDGVPQKGDIVIWGTGVGPYGHIAVFLDGNTSTFTSFDQNWPVNSLCHKQPHNYNGVLGWLHPQKTVTDPVAGSETLKTSDLVDLRRKETAYNTYCDSVKLDKGSATGDMMLRIPHDLQSLAENQAQELEQLRKERDEAVSKVCPDPGVHNPDVGGSSTTGTNGDNTGDSGTSDSNDVGNTPEVPNVPANPRTGLFDALISAFKSIFGGK